MTQTKIKQFFAISFDNQIYKFVLGKDEMLYCKEIAENKPIKKVYIKPNFETFFKDGRHISCDGLARERNFKNGSNHLIGSYVISQELLEYLISLNRISYSTEMAYLYGLDQKFARDAKTKSNAFKRVKKRDSQILPKQKQGIFN